MNAPPPPPLGSAIINRESQTSQLSIQLSNELYSRHSLPVSTEWLNTFLSTVRAPLPPLTALASTAQFRILNSDFTTSLDTSSGQALKFPPGITDVRIKSQTLATNVPVQVLSIEDVGTSRWSQIEAIERVERGEEVKGREVIRTVPTLSEESTDDSTTTTTTITATAPNSAVSQAKRSNGPHKLLLQDAEGTKISGFELSRIPKVFITNTVQEGDLGIGCKMLLKRGTVVRRGMVMLESENVVVLGGKIELWDKAWRIQRKENLRVEIARENEGS